MTWTPSLISLVSIWFSKHGHMYGGHVLIILPFLTKSRPQRRLCLKLILHNIKENEVAKTKGTEIIVRMNVTMFGTWYGGVGGQQGCLSQEGGPRLIRFESPRWRLKTTQVRVYLGLQDQSTLNWSPRTHPDSVFDDQHIIGKLI